LINTIHLQQQDNISITEIKSVSTRFIH